MSPPRSFDFLAHLGGSIAATDLEGRILYWNAEAEALSGFAFPEVHRKDLRDFFPPEVRRDVNAALGSPGPNIGMVTTCAMQRRGGETVWVTTHLSVLLDERRRPNALLLAFHPVPEAAASPGRTLPPDSALSSEKSEKEIYQARKAQAIGALAAGLAHDFNNILASVLAHLELLTVGQDLPENVLSHATRARKSATRASELVSRLLAFSRLAPPVLKSVHLPPLIDEALVALRRRIDSSIAISNPPASDALWSINGDADHILQVITNLLFNARDVMPKGGTLAIETANVRFAEAEAKPPRRAGEFVRITVADSGKGISPELAARIFEPSFSSKQFGKGVGLGLTIVNSIVSEHGGWMEVKSELGQGNRFHAFLPRLKDSPPAYEAPRDLLAADNQSWEGKETILFVDDDEMVRLVARAILAYRGYTVIEAVSGVEAIEKFRASPNRFDLVMLDLHLADMNSWDVLARLHEIRPPPKVILLGTSAKDEFSGNVTDLGVGGLLLKPFDNIELLRQVRRVLDGGKV